MTDVEFHSLDVRQPNFFASQAVKISGATEFGRFGVSAPFRPEKIHPKATLTSVHRSIRPKDYKISAASDNDDRDMLPLSDAEINAASEACKEGEDQQPPSNGTLVYKSLLTVSHVDLVIVSIMFLISFFIHGCSRTQLLPPTPLLSPQPVPAVFF